MQDHCNLNCGCYSEFVFLIYYPSLVGFRAQIFSLSLLHENSGIAKTVAELILIPLCLQSTPMLLPLYFVLVFYQVYQDGFGIFEGLKSLS